MKKFLSLLLALTMVMSLVVVPARADTGSGGSGSGGETPATPSATLTWSADPTITVKSGGTTVTSVTKGASLTFEVGALTVTKADGSAATLGTDYTVSYVWSNLPGGLTATNSATITGTTNTAGTFSNVTCAVTVTTKPAEGAGTAVGTKNATASVTVNDAILDSDVTTVSFNGRPYTKSAVYYASSENQDLTTAAKWTIDGYNVTNAAQSSGNTYTLTVTKGAAPNLINGTITVTAIQAQATGDIAIDPAANHRAGQPLTFSLPDTVNNQSSTHASFSWLIKKGAADLKTGTSKTLAWTPTEDGTYTVTCAVKEGGKEVNTLTLASLVIAKENYRAEVVAPATAGSKYLNGSSVPYSFSFKDYTNSAAPTDIDLRSTDITWAVTGGGATFATTKPKGGNGTASNTLTLGSIAGNVTVTATFTYLGKNYTVTFPTITNVVPTYTLGSTYCGYNNSSYIPSTLVSYANSALSAAGITGVTAGSVALSSAPGNVTATGAAASGYTLTASATYLGTAELTATVTKARGGTFTMTFKVPVLPIPYSTSVIGTAYAEPYTTGSNYYYNTYRVTLPTTFNQYSVVSKNTSPNSNVSSAPTSGVTTVTLNQNEFVNGQCTLYVIAWNSNYNGYGYGYNYGTNYYGKYYSGAITVYQNSNDIEYTGVAGSTVNFAHSSFTAFMNAMNTASSSYYYQFEDVTFDYFSNSTQGTLYYGSTAMTSGSYSSSSYFNSATKITNLDNVSFAINSRIPSTVKEIVVPFKLHAKQYYNNNTYGTAVTFSGRVVISVAREDIIINVAAGDTVKLDASAFLSYLRASSTAYRNSNIDYVTFDQNISNSSNSSLVNGALYTYYTNSYSFGSAVKSSDRFYYSSTAYNVSNLSDVAFRSNAYATAGTTVYIPFTIKLLNSNATVTGTLAAKISAAVNFYDVKASDYYYDAVKWAVGQGVTKGTGNNMFSPSKGCTRAEIVTFLWRAAGSKAPKSYSNRFTDVSSGMGSDFYNAILWAVGEGITTGTSTTTFSPNATCTRGQIVTFLHRYQKTPGGYYANSFKDVKSGDYCYNAVIWAYGSGVAKGTSNTTFSPNATCTRGDAVTFLYRAIAK